MYAPKVFQPKRSECLAFAAARGFGTICTIAAGRPVAMAVPFCLSSAADGTPLIAFHIARKNPLAAFADGLTPFLMAVNGPDAYVSADWYASPDQVPTWLYQAVHLSGTVTSMDDDALAAHLDALSAHFEARLSPKKPWTSTKMSTGRLEAMKKAIVGLVMSVDELEGSFKLNQHKSDADKFAVGTALMMQPDEAAQSIGEMVVARTTQTGDTLAPAGAFAM